MPMEFPFAPLAGRVHKLPFLKAALAFTKAILISEPKKKALLSLNFPLCNGVYYVAQGGANRLLNYHHPSRSQCYALDVTKKKTPPGIFVKEHLK